MMKEIMDHNNAIGKEEPQKQTGKGRNLTFGGGGIILSHRKTSETNMKFMNGIRIGCEHVTL